MTMGGGAAGITTGTTLCCAAFVATGLPDAAWVAGPEPPATPSATAAPPVAMVATAITSNSELAPPLRRPHRRRDPAAARARPRPGAGGGAGAVACAGVASQVNHTASVGRDGSCGRDDIMSSVPAHASKRPARYWGQFDRNRPLVR